MKKILSVMPFMMALLVLALDGRAVPLSNEQAGRTAADEWLVLVDAGKLPESWQKLEPAFAKKVGKKKWTSALNEIRSPLGKLTSRALKSAEYTKELPGAPEGEYVIVQFTSSFERKKEATEKVTLLLGRDLFWRVASYSVK